jgi:DNA-binding XRE family transcriptional regulator
VNKAQRLWHTLYTRPVGEIYAKPVIANRRSRRMAASGEVRVQHYAPAEMGSRIVEMRKHRGWTQAELAQSLRWSCATLHQWESGQSGEAGLNPVLLIGLCHVLGCTLDDLYYGKGPRP